MVRRPQGIRVRSSLFWWIILILMTVSLCAVSGRQTATGSTSPALIVATEGGDGKTVLHLYMCTSGKLEESWSTTILGSPRFVSLNDINKDGEPEIVVGIKLAGAYASILIYENISGIYDLVLNRTSIGPVTLARACMIDYYDNATEFLIAGRGRFLLIGYESGRPVLKEELPFSTGGMGFDVGDVNGDDRPDIVRGSAGGFIVLENQGEGRYLERIVKGETPSRIDSVRIRDVDGDPVNEIVMVGCCPPRPSLSIWKYVEGQYEEIWSYYGATIQSLDIGDVHGDGVNEIVTAAAEWLDPSSPRGLSIWKFQPEIVYKGRVLEPGGFYRLWEDENTKGEDLRIGKMLVLRVAPIDETGVERIVASGIHGSHGSAQAVYLYIAEREQGKYNSRRIFLWPDHVQYPCLDVWRLERVDEFTPTCLIMLVSAVFLRHTPMLRRVDQSRQKSSSR